MKTLRIKDICDKGSSNLKQKDVENQNGVYPVFGASGLIGKIDTYHQNKDYIAIVKDGSGIGRVTFMPAFSSVIGTLQYILPKEGFNIKYISYCLQSLDLAHYKQGAAIPHIYFRDYGEYEVNVEENPDDQQRIVSYLDAEFAKIEALKANAEKQLQAAKDLFQAALKELLTPKEGWVEKKLGDLSLYYNGLTYKPSDVSKQGFLVLRSSNIQNNKLSLEDQVRVSVVVNDKLKIHKGDIIMCSRNGSKALIGKVAIIPEEYEDLTFGTFMMVIKSKFNPFLYYFFLSERFKGQIWKGEANMINQITRYMLDDVFVCLPTNIDEQHRIVARLDALSANVKALQTNYTETITLCNDLKQALLKKVFG